jgi:hypothetical protein
LTTSKPLNLTFNIQFSFSFFILLFSSFTKHKFSAEAIKKKWEKHVEQKEKAKQIKAAKAPVVQVSEESSNQFKGMVSASPLLSLPPLTPLWKIKISSLYSSLFHLFFNFYYLFLKDIYLF